MQLGNEFPVQPPRSLFVQQGEEDHSLVDPPVGLAGKDVAVERAFEEEVVPPLHCPAERHGPLSGQAG